ncbi:hypothetical protein AA103196_0197 [Ameyamaea chiangmaiensis NBRC 103196]|nr:hypothetical protein AA103196_0197 [Ameyamaea chiangmaiensis NBRC 103196]
MQKGHWRVRGATAEQQAEIAKDPMQSVGVPELVERVGLRVADGCPVLGHR